MHASQPSGYFQIRQFLPGTPDARCLTFLEEVSEYRLLKTTRMRLERFVWEDGRWARFWGVWAGGGLCRAVLDSYL